MKTFIIARGMFGPATPFVERVTIDCHRAPRVSALTVSIVDGNRVLAELSATFYGLRCPLRLADVEAALAECRADVALFHDKSSDYAPVLMTPDSVGVVSLVQALAH